MDLQTALEIACDQDAILFAGSGFACGATCISKETEEKFLTGRQLRDLLGKKCNLSDDEYLSYNLPDLADYFIDQSKSKEPLITLLKDLFSVKTIAQHHKDILSIHWKRLYTTNYDKIIETAALDNNYCLSSIVLSNSEKIDKKIFAFI